MIASLILFAALAQADPTNDTAEHADKTKARYEQLLSQVRNRFPVEAQRIDHEACEARCYRALKVPLPDVDALGECIKSAEHRKVNGADPNKLIAYYRVRHPELMARQTDAFWRDRFLKANDLYRLGQGQGPVQP